MEDDTPLQRGVLGYSVEARYDGHYHGGAEGKTETGGPLERCSNITIPEIPASPFSVEADE